MSNGARALARFTVGSAFVKRLLFLTQPGVDGDCRLPRPVLQPTPLHLDLAALRRRFALILRNVETPSLLRWPRLVLAKLKFFPMTLTCPADILSRSRERGASFEEEKENETAARRSHHPVCHRAVSATVLRRSGREIPSDEGPSDSSRRGRS